MKRRQLIEVHDEPWCPNLIREALTDFLGEFIRVSRVYEPALALLRAAVERTGAPRILDLCSGGGGPWIAWDRPVPVLLSDKYPNRAMIARLQARPLPALDYHPQPVDATRVPPGLGGFRTLFTCFHHFRPQDAIAILRDAAQSGQPVGVFEFTWRHPLAIPLMFTNPFGVWALAYRHRPLSWLRLALTYVLPVIPLLVMIDGIASCWRSYKPEELLEMARAGAPSGFHWQAGTLRAPLWPLPVTYLIGWPDAADILRT